MKEIPLNLTFLNFDPKNEIAFKFTRKSLLNAARARLPRGFIKGIPYKMHPFASLARAVFLKGFLWKIEAAGKILKGYSL